MATYEQLAQEVVKGKRKLVIASTNELLQAGEAPLDIINKALVVGMSEVGVLFQQNKMFIPEVLMSAKAMEEGINIVKPLLQAGDMKSNGTVIMATVQGDLHDIGKNLVGIMLESNGFTVINAGKDVSPEQLVNMVKELKPDVLGMSAMLTTTMLHMKDTIELLKEEGIRDQVKVIIGGAPVSTDFSTEITADGFAPDALSAVGLCKRLL
ncbi:cobalamin B12-binding domain-containing protein [Acidaminobacter sp.]|uniref:cobalamin B12-binding domain-containing protein n=1 Tax=Acidaminobacter sp. TaxID=1872102 RepID=UPI00138000E0|nr:corrinoid protein [Acidaminobacter sp.]MDK9711909.1 corrinoid protein [Acidaminobacter sp.]MZQ97306.1 cobalamin-binding protein [Acidaminobacter sp.]